MFQFAQRATQTDLWLAMKWDMRQAANRAPGFGPEATFSTFAKLVEKTRQEAIWWWGTSHLVSFGSDHQRIRAARHP